MILEIFEANGWNKTITIDLTGRTPGLNILLQIHLIHGGLVLMLGPKK